MVDTAHDDEASTSASELQHPRHEPAIPERLVPSAHEAAVLSAVLLRDGASWVVASGSLLTVDRPLAFTSWKRWDEIQPAAWRRAASDGFDLGPVFVVEPFAGVRAIRQVVAPESWHRTLATLTTGTLETPALRCELRATAWTSTALLGIDGGSDTHHVVAGARRPVIGAAAILEPPAAPPSGAVWELACPTYLKPGPDLGRIAPQRRLLHWPQALLGVYWLGSNESRPPPRFVVGRLQHEAWVARVVPDYDAEELKIHIVWDETNVDPLSCSLVVRNEDAGLPLLTRQVRISDYPRRSENENPADPEPRSRPWNERILTIAVPRGPRRTDWGLQLLSPDGRLLDERPVAQRIEQINFAMHVNGAQAPTSTFTVGDQKPLPSPGERDLGSVVQQLCGLMT